MATSRAADAAAVRVGRPETWRVVLAYAVLTAALAFPLSIHPASAVLSDAPDTDLTLWILSWNAHALATQPLHVFDANIFAPSAHTLAYSENFLGSMPIAAPIIWLTSNPVLAMNVVSLLSVLFCGLGGWLLARRLGLSAAGAFIAGLVYAFAPPRFLRLDQLHMATVQWIPFALAFGHDYLAAGERRDLQLAIAFFVLQVFTSGHGAVFAVVGLAVLAVWHLLRGVPIALGSRLRDAGVVGLALVLSVLPVMWPYLAVQRAEGLRRTLVTWSVPAASYLASPTRLDQALLTAFGAGWINDEAGAYLFPGVVPIALAAVAFVAWGARRNRDGERLPPGELARAALEAAVLIAIAAAAGIAVAAPIRWRVFHHVVSIANSRRAWMIAAALLIARGASGQPRPQLSRIIRERAWPSVRERLATPTGFYAMLAGISFWLAAGPPVSLWPYVYWLPGMNFIRQPSRFTILTVLALGGLAGLGVDRLRVKRSAFMGHLVAVACGALLVIEFWAGAFELTPRVVSAPAVDAWLAGQPGRFTIAELPLPDPSVAGPIERRQSAFMLHTLAHWQKTVNGYSGFTPPAHQALFQAMHEFPDSQSMRALASFGVTFVVIHTSMFEPGEWTSIESRLQASAAPLRLVHADGEGRIYRLEGPPRLAVRPAQP